MNPSDRYRSQLCLRSRGPVFVRHIDRFDEQMGPERHAQRAGRGVARMGRAEERAQPGGIIRGFLNGCGLKIVELGENELLQLRIAARNVNPQCGPGLTQKYL